MRFSFIRSAVKIMNMSGQIKHTGKRPRLSFNSKLESSYFESYADISVHEEMLGDEIRTNAYRKAIFSLKSAIQGKVVLDVGAGTGILSCFCAQAGAKKVYAVEASGIAKQAQKVVISNGLEKQIEVIHGLVEDVILPEKVDIIVSEWMGYCLLYESMLSSVLTARDKWLKPGGIILPSSAAVYLVPICDDEAIVEKVNFWSDMEEVYGVDMSSMLPFARSSLSKDVMVKTISCENVLSKPQLLAYLNLSKITQADIEAVKHDFTFKSFGIGDFQGFALWFDVFFPPDNALKRQEPYSTNSTNSSSANEGVDPSSGDGKPLVSSGAKNNHLPLKETSVILSTSPYKEETHWKQSILYLDKEIPVLQDTNISGSIALSPCATNRRFLNIQLSYRVNDGDSVEKSFFMGYELTNRDDSP